MKKILLEMRDMIKIVDYEKTECWHKKTGLPIESNLHFNYIYARENRIAETKDFFKFSDIEHPIIKVNLLDTDVNKKDILRILFCYKKPNGKKLNEMFSINIVFLPNVSDKIREENYYYFRNQFENDLNKDKHNDILITIITNFPGDKYSQIAEDEKYDIAINNCRVGNFNNSIREIYIEDKNNYFTEFESVICARNGYKIPCIEY